jgi:predicted amidophosphoribosyltransferase
MTRRTGATILRFGPRPRCIGCGDRVHGTRLWCPDCTPEPSPLADLVRLLFRCRDCERPLAWGRRGLRHVRLDERDEIAGSLRTGHRARFGGPFLMRSHALERGA